MTSPILNPATIASADGNAGNGMEEPDNEFGAVSYLQKFRKYSKEWNTNPYSGDEERLSEETIIATAIAASERRKSRGNSLSIEYPIPQSSPDDMITDRLQLLTNSAGLIASPISRIALNLQPNHRSSNHHINFNEKLTEHHYLDTMMTDISNMSHAGKVLANGRARSSSMSILEGTSSLSVGTFDNPALARIKGKLLAPFIYSYSLLLCFFFHFLYVYRKFWKENCFTSCS
jgi:hypothetical protein